VRLLILKHGPQLSKLLLERRRSEGCAGHLGTYATFTRSGGAGSA